MKLLFFALFKITSYFKSKVTATCQLKAQLYMVAMTTTHSSLFRLKLRSKQKAKSVFPLRFPIAFFRDRFYGEPN